MTKDYTHAGGVVVRRRDDDVEVLLVTARNRPDQWVLPKGHIEAGETTETTALREVEEECGVIGKILAKAGDSSFTLKEVDIVTAFYLIEYESSVSTTEGRKLRWCKLDEAVDRVSFDDSRDIIRRALRLYRETDPSVET